MAAGEARRKRMIGPGVARFIKVTSQFTSHFSATEGPHTWSPPVRYIGQIERQRVSFHISHTSAFEGVGAEEWVYGDVAQGGGMFGRCIPRCYTFTTFALNMVQTPPTMHAILTKATIGGLINVLT